MYNRGLVGSVYRIKWGAVVSEAAGVQVFFFYILYKKLSVRDVRVRCTAE